jgi:hypothetical protein
MNEVCMPAVALSRVVEVDAGHPDGVPPCQVTPASQHAASSAVRPCPCPGQPPAGRTGAKKQMPPVREHDVPPGSRRDRCH